MPFIIDTDIAIHYLQENAEIIELLERLAYAGVFMSVISYMEAFQGVISDPHSERAETRFNAFLLGIDVIPVTQQVARRCATLRSGLHRRGKRVRQRALDLLIAATAIEHNLTLVTRNQADYSDIPGIVLFEDF